MKKLITAADIRQSALSGVKTVEYTRAGNVITPEAYEVARELGVALVEAGSVSEVKTYTSCGVKPNLFPLTDPIIPAGISPEMLRQIRLAVIAQLPSGSVPESLIDQLVAKVISEQNMQTKAVESAPRVLCIGAKDIHLEPFPGHAQVGIADLIGVPHGSSMAGGIMAWDNYAFNWLLNYDEVDYIIEGELHLSCKGELTIARAGDVLFIPKGSPVEFATPTHVKFFYAASPADWQNQ